LYVDSFGNMALNLDRDDVEKLGIVSGARVELEIAGERYTIDGRGGKDHSWGVRDWFRPQAWRWIDLVGSGLTAECALWRATFDGEEWVEDGAVFTDGQALGLEAYREHFTTAPRERKERPAQIAVAVDAGGRTLEAEGRVVRVVPIFFGRDADGGRLVSWNDRALVECTVDGRPAWANVEFESLVRE
jgi:hypothetical protein